jgi:hypothetical protein
MSVLKTEVPVRPLGYFPQISGEVTSEVTLCPFFAYVPYFEKK